MSVGKLQAEVEGEKSSSGLPTEQGSPHGAQSPDPQDHDLIQNQVSP